MSASLFVVATPIGNLEDITQRAVTVLQQVALVAAEDTRRTGTLLRHLGITTPTTSFHAHNERQKLPYLLRTLSEGKDVALVSDAGTPVVADPGQRLITAAIEDGIRIVPIPGPSAVLAAMVVSGMAADTFTFAGFVPARSNDRLRWLEELVAEPRPVVMFEAPHRIRKTLDAIALVFGERPIIICRELTKIHEEVIRTRAREAPRAAFPEKGEFSIVIAEAEEHDIPTTSPSDEDVYEMFCRLIEKNGINRRGAAATTANYFGLSTNTVYALVERMKLDRSS